MASRTPVWKQSERIKMNRRIRILVPLLAALPGVIAGTVLLIHAHSHRAPPPADIPPDWIGCLGADGANWLEEGDTCHEKPADRAPDYIILAPGVKPDSALRQLCGHACDLPLANVPRQPPCPERRGCA